MLVRLLPNWCFFPVSNVGRAWVEKQALDRSSAAADCPTGDNIVAGRAPKKTQLATDALSSKKVRASSKRNCLAPHLRKEASVSNLINREGKGC